MHKYPDLKTQLERAKLIVPYFVYLTGDEKFLADIKTLRHEYGLDHKIPAKHEIPLYLLYQDQWNPDPNTLSFVNCRYSQEERIIWRQFHKETEILARKYQLGRFPNLIKDFIITEGFTDLTAISRIKFRNATWEAKGSVEMKKVDFEKIWGHILDYRNKYLPLKSLTTWYPEEIRKKYSSAKKIEDKYSADQADIFLLMKKHLDWISEEEEMKIKMWDKYKKSRLNTLVKTLFSLVEDVESI